MDLSSQTATSTSVTGIDRLHPEILLIIFDLLRHNPTRRQTFCCGIEWEWAAVTHVCRYWRGIALNAPSLWSKIYYDDGKAKLQAYLERSKNADLYVSFWKPKHFFCGKKLLVEGLGLVLEKMERISKLQVACDNENRPSFDNICHLLSYPTPRLRELCLHMTGSFLELPHIQLTAPLLRKYWIEGFRLSTNFAFPNNLERLTMDRLSNVSTKGVLACIIGCPELKLLVLGDITWTRDLEPFAISDKALISLSHLQKLSVRSDSSCVESLNRIFKRIRLPDDLDWMCEIENATDDEMDSLFESTFYIDLLAAPKSCRTLTICIKTVCDVAAILECSRVRKKTWVDDGVTSENFCQKKLFLSSDSEILQDYALSSHFLNFGSLIETCHLTAIEFIKLEVSLRDDDDNATEEDWLQLLLSLPSVRFINLTHPNNGDVQADAGVFARALAKQVHNDTLFPDGCSICPKLERVRLEIAEGIDVEENFIESLKFGLRARKQLGFGLKCFEVVAKHIGREYFASIEECVEELLVSLPKRKRRPKVCRMFHYIAD